MQVLNKFGPTLSRPTCPKRNFWAWLNIIFNRVDEQRIQQFGPDRVCAEWLLRNGAGIKWVNNPTFLNDYNALPLEGVKFNIEEVEAKESSIMHYGFVHFRGCKFIKKIVFNKCSYIEDEALKDLAHLKNSLEELQIIDCPNLTANGLSELGQLDRLKILKLAQLPYVRDKNSLVGKLEEKLKKCEISFE